MNELIDCCDNVAGCVSPSGRKTSLNETWQEDDCTQCVCTDGQTKCLASFCQTPCLHPRKVKGECCPVCDGNIQSSTHSLLFLVHPELSLASIVLLDVGPMSLRLVLSRFNILLCLIYSYNPTMTML